MQPHQVKRDDDYKYNTWGVTTRITQCPFQLLPGHHGCVSGLHSDAGHSSMSPRYSPSITFYLSITSLPVSRLVYTGVWCGQINRDLPYTRHTSEKFKSIRAEKDASDGNNQPCRHNVENHSFQGVSIQLNSG